MLSKFQDSKNNSSRAENDSPVPTFFHIVPFCSKKNRCDHQRKQQRLCSLIFVCLCRGSLGEGRNIVLFVFSVPIRSKAYYYFARCLSQRSGDRVTVVFNKVQES